MAPYRRVAGAGRVLKADTEVRFRVLDPYKRPVSVTADSHETRDVVEVTIRESKDRRVTLLFDPEAQPGRPDPERTVRFLRTMGGRPADRLKDPHRWATTPPVC